MPGVRLIKISKKQLGEVPKLKGNSFYGKMIEDLAFHKSIRFTLRV